jgi:amino acid adenylation domain-containing protein
MTAQQCLHLLFQKKIFLTVDGSELVVDASENALTDDVITLIKAHKAALIALLNKLSKASNANVIKKTERKVPNKSVCSLAQQRMLFMEELAGNQSFYNIPVAYHIQGELNIKALDKAFSSLIDNHDIFRTTYANVDDVQYQHIADFHHKESSGFSIDYLDYSDSENQSLLLSNKLETDASHCFDLTSEWPIKASIIQLGKNEYVLSINIHHIATDGFSAKRIISDLNKNYSHYLQHQSCFTNNSIQYVDYVNWQNTWLNSTEYQQSKQYWLGALKDMPMMHSLTSDFLRPSINSVTGKSYTTILPTKMVDQLKQVSNSHNSTPFILIQSVFAALLARYSDTQDITFGVAVANRNPVEFANCVGLFVNTLVMRYQIDMNQTFASLIEDAKRTNLLANKHQQFPFDSLVEELQPVRNLSCNPLVQIMLVMHQTSTDLNFAQLKTTSIYQQQAVAKFDIALHVTIEDSKVSLRWEYSSNLYKESSIIKMSRNFETLLEVTAANRDVLVGDVVLNQDRQLEVSKNDFPKAITVNEMFEASVAKYPNNIAVQDGNLSLSYLELNNKSNAIAQHISRVTDGDIDRIGVCMGKSSHLISAMLAIFKLGSVYVPIDPHYPKDRIENMVNDAGMEIMLTDTETALPYGIEESTLVINVDCLIDSDVLYQANNNIDNQAYIIYTSGSTGKPKGVLVSQRSLFYSLMANKSRLSFTANDEMPTIGSQAFGVSLLEILLPLITGGTVKITPKEVIRDIKKLVEATKSVSVLHAVPSVMSQWLDEVEAQTEVSYSNLRLLLVGGEPVPNSLLTRLKAWRSDVCVLELFGMTESAVISSCYEKSNHDNINYCIGKPLKNTQFFVLNKSRQRQPEGIPGELCIGGLSLATEYINQAKETDDKFIISGFYPQQRLYRTGDRVRELADGNYEFLGRIDNQVSLRGARIELGEIESLAMELDEVDKAIAHVIEFDNAEKTLVLYYRQTKSGGHPSNFHQTIQDYLKQKLPEHMMPSFFQSLQKFPLNPNGKVDRAALPSPRLNGDKVAPESDLEKQLMKIWLSVLPVESLCVNDNFFEIGGHSLLATKLIGKVRTHFDVSIPITALFESPTIRSCAKVLEKALLSQYSQTLSVDNRTDKSDVEDEIFI